MPREGAKWWSPLGAEKSQTNVDRYIVPGTRTRHFYFVKVMRAAYAQRFYKISCKLQVSIGLPDTDVYHGSRLHRLPAREAIYGSCCCLCLCCFLVRCCCWLPLLLLLILLLYMNALSRFNTATRNQPDRFKQTNDLPGNLQRTSRSQRASCCR